MGRAHSKSHRKSFFLFFSLSLNAAPTLFTGTIKSNLSPGDEHSDAEVWEVLGKVQMRDKIANLDGGIHAPVLSKARVIWGWIEE